MSQVLSHISWYSLSCHTVTLSRCHTVALSQVFLLRHIMKPGKCSLVDGYYMFILRYASNGDWTAIARWVSMVLEE